MSAGTSIASFVARLVLAAAFIPAGYNKLTKTDFEGHAAEVLNEMGVGDPVSATVSAPTPDQNGVMFASFQQDEAAEDMAADPVTEAAEDATEELPVVLDSTPVNAYKLYHVAVLLDDAGWDPTWKPDFMAWAAALTELVGGCLILLGLFSRIWGLSLSVAMGSAFYLTSYQSFGGTTQIAELLANHDFFHMAIAQLALFALAFSVLALGPGKLSLDRFFFGGGRSIEMHDEDDED